MMKRFLALILALVLTAGFACAESAPAAEAADTRLEVRNYPWYLASPDQKMEGDVALPLWFADGADDLPFIELTDWIPLTNPDHRDLETDLLTRVQWPNSRKNRLFKKENYEKLPGWLKDALAEIDAME